MSTWNIDKSHSEIQFKVKHMVISTVTGNFNDFDGALELGEDSFESAKIKLEVDVDSIDTRNENRDAHLKSAEFFGAEEFPKMHIQVEDIVKKSEDEFILRTRTTIKGVERPVELVANYGGIINDMYGYKRMGLEVSGKINRQDFGLTWSAMTETGGLVVSDEVRLIGNIEFVKA